MPEYKIGQHLLTLSLHTNYGRFSNVQSIILAENDHHHRTYTKVFDQFQAEEDIED